MGRVAACLVVLAASTASLGRLHVLLHILQQEHYENARLRVWLRAHRRRADLAGATLVAVLLAVAAAVAWASTGAALAIAAVALVAGAVVTARLWRREQVKALVFTARARRLFVVALALGLVPALVGALVVGGATAVTIAAALGMAMLAGCAWLLMAAVMVTKPLDRANARRFANRARRTLADVDPLVVAITGSYGKTTTKACVAEVLELMGPSYPTPASFNSYLGVVRAINEGLLPSHRSFVAEMGAYRRGDVAELCVLVSPKVGVLTAIGPAHLERFGSIDEIERAKGELAEALPADGIFVTDADDERCLRVARTRTGARVVMFSVTANSDAQVWAQDVHMENGRTAFALCSRGDDGAVRSAAVRAKLLGEHNVANLLAAAAVGIALGLELDAVARALGRVAPPAHRLAPIVNSANRVVVIDDSYNANPQGAAAALAVLRSHPAQRRVLVTPGMVELGESEERENVRLGELAAAACDRAVLIGADRAAAVRSGMVGAGFPEASIVMAADSRTAHEIIGQTTLPGDVILFENDLPDVYAQ